ncbi:carbohydrate ABC transporter permease [Streptomyces xanthophaeus]|uniref:carbohydrate ABC transporter permease n=1 Tax=Streptomyces xanthophaeus TaxID=67385 RepID=UPI0004CD05C8|nr:carbohydrate ABC transporter permease [Streptomyces xanthophaeus]WST26166.1 carbohydrate ABC transporter permease [Streptomyces xanthophaeus]WST58858.1 carbohydrate ABC transporter permease [Streptomyces xanthophaeus]
MSTQTAAPRTAEHTGAAPAPPAPTPRRRPRRAWASKTAVNAVLIMLACYTLMPVSWLLIAATKNRRDLFGTDGFSLGEFNLFSNIHEVFTHDDGIYGRWLLNTVLYAVVGSALSSLVSVAAGYAFDKYEFSGKEKLFGVVLAGVLVPGAVLTLPMYLLASQAGLTNTYWALLIPSLVNPFGVYLARVFCEGYVPYEVIEAARVDGAGDVRTFRSIALPMLAPGFVTLFLFSFTASWNNFYGALIMLNDKDLYPVSLGLHMWNISITESPEMYSLAITGSLIAVVPLVIAFLCLQRFWRSGLTAGAVK